MADPLTLSALTASALTEGIKFLYGQASELLKRKREGAPEVPDEAAALLESELRPLRPDSAVLERLRPELRAVRGLLTDYADEIEPATPEDDELLRRVDALRRLLEAIYGQAITFRGEPRPATGPLVEGALDVDAVAGYAAAVRARSIGGSAHVRGEATVGSVTEHGEVVGIDVDRIGDQ